MNKIHDRVRFATPTDFRRPQPGSQRTVVLRTLEEVSRSARGPAKAVPIEALNDRVGFNCRPFLQKLVGAGHARFVDYATAPAKIEPTAAVQRQTTRTTQATTESAQGTLAHTRARSGATAHASADGAESRKPAPKNERQR